MSPTSVFLYAEYQVSIPFDSFDWKEANERMSRFPGLLSKTWLSGLNTHTIGGFYEFDTLENARKYVREMLAPLTRRLNGSLSVKLFDANVTRAASLGMKSPFYSE